MCFEASTESRSAGAAVNSFRQDAQWPSVSQSVYTNAAEEGQPSLSTSELPVRQGPSPDALDGYAPEPETSADTPGLLIQKGRLLPQKGQFDAKSPAALISGGG